MMRGTPLLLSLPLVVASATADVSPLPVRDAYIEFLWTKTPQGALARQETHSFALDGRFDHQVCVAVLNESIKVESMQLRASGPSGEQVIDRTYPDFDGAKRCVPADLPRDAVAGKWTYEVRLNGRPQVVASQSVDVHDTVQALIASTKPGTPYVLGRPNYDATIPPAEYEGELVWTMHINQDGSVRAVDIDRAEGIGVRMQPKAVSAGMMSLFPPDPARESSATYQRHLSFRPDR